MVKLFVRVREQFEKYNINRNALYKKKNRDENRQEKFK